MRRAIVLPALGLLAALALTGCSKHHVYPTVEGLPVKIGGLDYTVFITRQLNVRDAEDRDYYPNAPDLPPGSAYFGVFVEVCNNHSGGPALTPTSDFKIVDTQGGVYTPSPLPANDIFAYRPIPLGSNKCIPVAGSIASGAPTGGALLLFRLPIAGIENRPLDLEIAPPATGESPKKERIELDI
jgi:hypothetical protein